MCVGRRRRPPQRKKARAVSPSSARPHPSSKSLQAKPPPHHLHVELGVSPSPGGCAGCTSRPVERDSGRNPSRQPAPASLPPARCLAPPSRTCAVSHSLSLLHQQQVNPCVEVHKGSAGDDSTGVLRRLVGFFIPGGRPWWCAVDSENQEKEGDTEREMDLGKKRGSRRRSPLTNAAAHRGITRRYVRRCSGSRATVSRSPTLALMAEKSLKGRLRNLSKDGFLEQLLVLLKMISLLIIWHIQFVVACSKRSGLTNRVQRCVRANTYFLQNFMLDFLAA